MHKLDSRAVSRHVKVYDKEDAGRVVAFSGRVP
jgi:hypothetical protein